MLTQERHNEILKMLIVHGGVIKMSELAAQFGVSNETIRRDLECLQKQNRVQRVHGGAILLRDADTLLSGGTEAGSRSMGEAERAAIGKACADLVQNGDTLMLSSGRTVLEVAKNLKSKKRLTIITNNFAVANALLDTSFDIYTTGGKIGRTELDLSGDIAIRALQDFYVDKAIVGAGGITFEYGISDYNSADTAVRAEMMQRSIQTILVAESHKFGKNAFQIKNNPLSQFNTVVTDEYLDEAYAERIKAMGIQLVFA